MEGVSASPSRGPRLALHWALAALLLPIVSLPLGWYAARRGRRWAAGILAVAFVDSIVIVALFAAPERFAPPAPAPRYVLGVRFEPGVEGHLVVLLCDPGTPAALAGIRPGDEVVTADGQDVRTIEELRAVVQASGGERPIRLVIQRGEDEPTFEVVPVLAESLAARPPVDVPEGSGGGDRVSLRDLAYWLRPLVPFVGALLLVLAASRWRSSAPPGAAILLAMFAVLILGGTILTLLADAATDGSVEGALIASAAMSLLITFLAARALQRVAPRRPTESRGGARLVASTVALGFFYIVTIGLRTVLVLGLVFGSSGLEERVADPIGELLRQPQGPGALTLSVVTIALLAPVAEELLFRGLLLGWLRRWKADIPAVGLTAALFALGHPHYGPGMMVTLVTGAVLGWARVRSGGLLAPIALHVLVNGSICAARLL